MVHARLVDVEGRRQVKYGLAPLDGRDPTGRERSSIADLIDLVQDRDGRIARPEEVGVEGVDGR